MKQRILICVAVVLFVAGIVCSLFLLFTAPKNKVLILRDGKVLYALNLLQEENRTFVIPYGESSNTIEIRDGKIRVFESECPDKVCVKTGWLSSSAIPIVCLPNHLVITFTSENDDVDAITQ